MRGLRAGLAEGEVTGEVHWSRDRGARFIGNIRGLTLPATFAELAWPRLPVSGSVYGEVNLESSQISRGISGGSAQLRITGIPTAPGKLLPVGGDANLYFSSESIRIEAPQLSVGQAAMAVSGLASWRGDLNLNLGLRTPNLGELEPLIAELKIDLTQATGGMLDSAGGSAQFDGHLEWSVGHYLLQGNLAANRMSFNNNLIASLDGQVSISDRQIEIKNGRMTMVDGSQLSLDLSHALGQDADTQAKAVLRNLNIELIRGPFGLDFPVTGRVTGEVMVSHWKPHPEYSGRVSISNGQIELGRYSTKFERLSGQLDVKAGRMDLQDIAIQVGPGQIAVNGFFDRLERKYHLIATGKDLPVAAIAPDFAQLAGGAQGDVQFNLTGEGDFDAPHLGGELRIDRFRIAEQQPTQIVLKLHSDGGTIGLQMVGQLFGHEQSIEGSLDLQDPARTLVARASLDQMDLKPYLQLARELPQDFVALVSGRTELRVSLLSPRDVRLRVELPSVRLRLGDRNFRNEDPLVAELVGNRLTLHNVHMSGDDTNVLIGGSFDLGAVNGSIGERLRASRADLSLDGQVNLQILRVLYPSLSVGGVAVVKANIRGTLSDPSMSGLADVRDASLRIVDFPVYLERGAGRMRFTSNETLIENFHALANGGNVTFSGGLIIKNYRAERWRFNTRAEGSQVRYPAGVVSVLDANLVLQGTRQLEILSGTASIRRAELGQEADIASWITGASEHPTTGMRSAIGVTWPIALDLRVESIDSIVVKNDLVDAIGSAKLHLSGSINDPIISGRASVSRGQLNFWNRDYQISRGILDLPGKVGERAKFNIEAETDIADYRVIISIIGTPDRFKATPRSDPPLPEQQVLALITTGSLGTPIDIAQLPPQTNVGLASALISETISRNIETGTRFFGVNRFRVAPLAIGRGSDPTARVSVGRQVTRNLSITYSTNVASAQDQVVIVEYRLSNRFSLVGTRDQDRKFSLDFRIRKKF